MSKSMNMLRTRRRDNNVKPNRRLDRKSSRGMIYENEELRLKTININAEIERGQSDIKKLRRENEMLKKEIWYLRDEYEKLDKLLKQKQVDFATSSSSTSSTSSEDGDVEATQNLENVARGPRRVGFEHLDAVAEESAGDHQPLGPDQSYPPCASGGTPDVIVKLDASAECAAWNGRTSFSSGGNVDDLLKDIESISMDILRMSSHEPEAGADPKFTSEASMVLMPAPMPLLGFDKYRLRTSSPEAADPGHADPPQPSPAPQGASLRRKVSLLHLKGRRDGLPTSSPTTPTPTPTTAPMNHLLPPPSSDSDHRTQPPNKSTSASPEPPPPDRKQHHKRKKQRSAICRRAGEPLRRERSSSTGGAADDCLPSSERERTNSVSSCGTTACSPQMARGVRDGSAGASGGKIPWCACWGNGCL